MTIKPFTQQDAKLLIATLGTEDRYQEIGELHEQFPQRLSETVLDFEEFWNQLPDDLADSAIPAVEKQVRTVVDSVQLIDGNRLLRKAWYRNAWRKWAEEPNDQRRDALYPLLTALAQAAGEDPNQALQQRDLCDRLQDASEEIRLLFPLEMVSKRQPELGRMATVIVRVQRVKPGAELPLVTFLPWSWPRYQDLQTVGQLNEILHPSLQAAMGPSASKLEQYRFLIELALPVCVGRYWSLDEHQWQRLAELAPNCEGVQGDSLGLAVAIAAWAAGENHSLAPTVATGKLSPRNAGAIDSVGGAVAKINAIKSLQQVFETLHVLLPADWQNDEAIPEPPKGTVWVRSLAQIFNQHGLLIDGFDAYRAAFESVSSVVADSKTCIDVDTTEQLENVCLEAFPTGSVMNLPDDPADRRLFHTITLPFDFGDGEPVILPRMVAAEATVRLMRKVIETGRHGDFNLAPVAVPVRLDRLCWFIDGGSRAADLQQLLGGLRQDWTEMGKCWQAVSEKFSLVPPAAFATALRRKQKLILCVYDQPSIGLWKGMASDVKAYESKLERLVSWSQSASHRLVAVCSDYRHQLLWEDAFGDLATNH